MNTIEGILAAIGIFWMYVWMYITKIDMEVGARRSSWSVGVIFGLAGAGLTIGVVIRLLRMV